MLRRIPLPRPLNRASHKAFSFCLLSVDNADSAVARSGAEGTAKFGVPGNAAILARGRQGLLTTLRHSCKFCTGL